MPSSVRGAQPKARSTFKDLPPDAHRRFTAEERDWGFTRFGGLRQLFRPQPGHNRPVIEGGSTVVSAYVRVLEDPTGVLWRSPVR